MDFHYEQKDKNVSSQRLNCFRYTSISGLAWWDKVFVLGYRNILTKDATIIRLATILKKLGSARGERSGCSCEEAYRHVFYLN